MSLSNFAMCFPLFSISFLGTFRILSGKARLSKTFMCGITHTTGKPSHRLYLLVIDRSADVTRQPSVEMFSLRALTARGVGYAVFGKMFGKYCSGHGRRRFLHGVLCLIEETSKRITFANAQFKFGGSEVWCAFNFNYYILLQMQVA